MRGFVFAGLAALALAACATTPPATDGPAASATIESPKPMAERVAGAASYICDDGQRFAVVYAVNPDGAQVTFESGEVRVLPAYPAGQIASGFGYKDGQFDLRGKGDEVRWTKTGAPSTTCRDVSQAK